MRVSTDDVASSRMSSAGSERNARAMVTSLLLTGADVAGLGVEHRVVAVGQRVHEPVDVGRLGRLHDLVVGRVRPAVGDVVADGPAEQPRVLEHHADLATQVVPRQVGDVDAVERDPARVEPRRTA